GRRPHSCCTRDPTSDVLSSDLGATFTGALSRAPGESVTGGPYAIGQNTLSAGTNYVITYVGANLTITAKAITVTADAQTKHFGEDQKSVAYGKSEEVASLSCAM